MVRLSVLTLLLTLLVSSSVAAQQQDARYWAQQGFKHVQMNQLEEAEKCYKKSLELKPDNGLVYANLTVVYQRTRRYADLVRAADKAIELGNKMTGVLLNRAEGTRRLAAEEKDKEKQKTLYEKAISDCEKIINHKQLKLNLTNKREVAYAHAILSVCHRALGEKTKAKKHRDIALQLDPSLKDQ